MTQIDLSLEMPPISVRIIAPRRYALLIAERIEAQWDGLFNVEMQTKSMVETETETNE